MIYEEKMALFRKIHKEIQNDPSLFGEIITVCTDGINEAIQKEKERAADMETIAMGLYSLTNGKYKEKNQKWIEGLISGKIKKWSNTSYLGGWEKVADKISNEEDE